LVLVVVEAIVDDSRDTTTFRAFNGGAEVASGIGLAGAVDVSLFAVRADATTASTSKLSKKDISPNSSSPFIVAVVEGQIGVQELAMAVSIVISICCFCEDDALLCVFSPRYAYQVRVCKRCTNVYLVLTSSRQFGKALCSCWRVNVEGSLDTRCRGQQ
jgi:hypothetical protein